MRAEGCIEKIQRLLARSNTVNPYQRLALEYVHSKLNNKVIKENMLRLYLEEFQLFQSLSHESMRDKECCFTGNTKYVYYRSELDDTAQAYRVSLPGNYSAQSRYPLLIIHDMNGEFTNCLSKYDDIPVIIVTISARGVTLGSYIGDFAIQEQIAHLFKYFSIDMNRVYTMGLSNGAAAVWTEAQHHPHRYAGICAFSGYLDATKIRNLSNLKVINVSSDYDDIKKESFDKLEPKILKHRNYTGILPPKYLHHWLYIFMGEKIL